jgi:hypothetical protein
VTIGIITLGGGGALLAATIAEPLPGYGTQVYLLSDSGAGADAPACPWRSEALAADVESTCRSRKSNLLNNCDFEDQHVTGVPDFWLLQKVAMADPYAGAADPFAAIATDAAFARSGWLSLRWTASRPAASRLRCANMAGLAENATYTLKAWAAAPSRKTPVSLLIVLEQGAGEFTPLVLAACALGRDGWTLCSAVFTTAGAKPALSFQQSSPGTIWLDDASLEISCGATPPTPPTRSWPLPLPTTSRHWRFTVLDSWDADGTFEPEPKLGEGPCVQYIQFEAAAQVGGRGPPTHHSVPSFSYQVDRDSPSQVRA